MGYHLGVCLRPEGNPPPLKLLLQCPIVFDYTVMNYKNIPIPISVRMGICLTGLSVGGPSCVGYSGCTIERPGSYLTLQIRNPAHSPFKMDTGSVLYCDSGRVITPVFKPL